MFDYGHCRLLASGGIISHHETPEWLCELENVPRASLDIMVVNGWNCHFGFLLNNFIRLLKKKKRLHVTAATDDTVISQTQLRRWHSLLSAASQRMKWKHIRVKHLNRHIDNAPHVVEKSPNGLVTCKTEVSIRFFFLRSTLSQEQGLCNYTILPYKTRMNSPYN